MDTVESRTETLLAGFPQDDVRIRTDSDPESVEGERRHDLRHQSRKAAEQKS